MEIKHKETGGITVEKLKVRYQLITAISTVLLTGFFSIVTALIANNAGFNRGLNENSSQINAVEYQNGYETGKNEGYSSGYETGKKDGYDNGYETGKKDGYDDGYKTGNEDGYNRGYEIGKKDGYDNSVALSGEILPTNEPLSSPFGAEVKLVAIGELGNSQSNYNFTFSKPDKDNPQAVCNTGDIFGTGVSMRASGDIDYFLNQKYRSFTGIIAASEETRNITDYSGELTIYSITGQGDNEKFELLYTSPPISMGFIPDTIGPLDVTNVTRLRFTFKTVDFVPYAPRIIIGNPLLYEK